MVKSDKAIIWYIRQRGNESRVVAQSSVIDDRLTLTFCHPLLLQTLHQQRRQPLTRLWLLPW